MATLNINDDFMRLFDCINCIKCLAAGERSGLCPDPLESPLEGREERKIEGRGEVVWTPPRFMTDRSLWYNV